MGYINNTVEFVLFNTTKSCFEVKSMEITRLEIREIALYQSSVYSNDEKGGSAHKS